MLAVAGTTVMHGSSTPRVAAGPREASATGFMKGQMNGAAILATADGAVPEFVFFEKGKGHDVNGFHVPYVNGEPTPEGLLRGLESFDQAYRDPARAAAIMRAAIAVTPMVSVKRTCDEMLQLYDRISAQPASTARPT